MPYRLYVSSNQWNSLLNSLVTVTRLCGKKKKEALYKYSNNENIPYQFWLYIKHIKMLIRVYITALKRFRIFSNLFDSQRVGTHIIKTELV